MSDTYVSKPVEIEAMQWRDHAAPGGTARVMYAEDVVAWVNANGGEARYEHGESVHGPQPRIYVRTNSGWAPCAPGWWVIKGSETFTIADRHYDYGETGTHTLLDHYPCDPETFAKRWERVS